VSDRRRLTGFHVDLLARARRSARVRAYVLTGGRTRTQQVLLVETFVSARPGVEPASALGPEAGAIFALGVVRVLLGDLERKGLILIHPDADSVPRRELLERVLRGLSDPRTV